MSDYFRPKVGDVLEFNGVPEPKPTVVYDDGNEVADIYAGCVPEGWAPVGGKVTVSEVRDGSVFAKNALGVAVEFPPYAVYEFLSLPSED